MTMLNVADWVECTEVEGPGKRFALWVQGCNILCEGCCNQEMLPFNPRKIMSVDEVKESIRSACSTHNIEGVTFLGGEPFLQALGLARVAQAARDLDLSVVLFSGFTLAQIRRQNLPGASTLLDLTDLLLDGPFIASRIDNERNWVGSTNQEFHFFTDRYERSIIFDEGNRSGVEIRMRMDGAMHVHGQPVAIDAFRPIDQVNSSIEGNDNDR